MWSVAPIWDISLTLTRTMRTSMGRPHRDLQAWYTFHRVWVSPRLECSWMHALIDHCVSTSRINPRHRQARDPFGPGPCGWCPAMCQGNRFCSPSGQLYGSWGCVQIACSRKGSGKRRARPICPSLLRTRSLLTPSCSRRPLQRTNGCLSLPTGVEHGLLTRSTASAAPW